MPPTGPWSARWTWPNATGLCCGSCCTRFRACWNATPRQRTAHAALIAEITGLLAGNGPAPPARRLRLPVEPLSESELRVLRYLPTNLTGPEIANELYVSPNTVKTHVRNLYAKLGTHRRAEAVTRARNLGLLAPAPAAPAKRSPGT